MLLKNKKSIDMMGFGDSDKLISPDPLRYSVEQQAKYIHGLMEELNVKRHVTFVAMDWGASFALYWGYLHGWDPDALRGLVIMQAVFRPLDSKLRPGIVSYLDFWTSPVGQQLILQENAFIEQVLPTGTLRKLSKEEMDEWRRPFQIPGERRRLIATLPTQVSVDGSNKPVYDMIMDCSDWLLMTKVPKLMFNANPGSIVMLEVEKNVVRSAPNVKEIQVKSLHFIPEDEPHKIGRHTAEWLTSL